MSLILKVMHHAAGDLQGDAAECDVFGDVVSCHFKHHQQGGGGEAHIWLREPVKTLLVDGYVEIEKYVQIEHTAYLMNEQGRTITKFQTVPIAGLAQAGTCRGAAEATDHQITARALRDLPYWSASLIRKACEMSVGFNGVGREIVEILDRERIAVDVAPS